MWKKWPKSDLSEATSDLEIEDQGHKTIAFVKLPIYTHIPNLKGLTKTFFKSLRPKEMPAAEAWPYWILSIPDFHPGIQLKLQKRL